MALPVSRLVKATVNLNPLAASQRSFGTLMIAGDSNVISGLQRFETFESIDDVAAAFGVNAPEYQAAALYFGQTPQPAVLMIGRWIRVASGGQNIGGILTASQKAITNWNTITSGGFVVSIDGSVQTLTGLNFTSATNLNAVADVINGALSGASIAYDGTKFILTSASSGAGEQASGTILLTANPSHGVQASGTITLSGQPSPGDSVTIKGTAVTFVSGTPSGNQVQISVVDDLGTAANLQAFLQASSDSNLAAMTYNTIGLVTTITARVYGTAGNSYGLIKSGSNIAVSGSGDLAGGVAPDTLTVDGTVITFVASSPSGNQVIVGPTDTDTSANLQAFLSVSTDTNIAKALYSTSNLLTTVVYKTTGTAGNAFTLAKSSTAITLSAGTLTGGAVASSVGYATMGSGTDISAQLKLTSATDLALVPGYNAESPVECAAILANLSNAWYGLMFQASVQPTDVQSLDVSTFIEALEVSRIYGVTVTDPNILSPLDTSDLPSLMMGAGYLRSLCQYSENQYAVASLFGRAFSVDFTANNSTITLMYKQEPSVTPEDLSSSDADTLEAKRCNVFVAYDNATSIIQYGTMSGPAWIDEIQGLDWFANDCVTDVYNLLYTSPTKIPQTDAGSNQLINAVGNACSDAVNNGLLAPGVWTGPSFGTLTTGQYLKAGFYIFIQPIALQSQADREARKAPPIQIAAKLAGAIQTVDMLINVNR